MKKFVWLFLFGALILALFVLGWTTYWIFLSKEVGKQVKLIQEVSDNTHVFNLPFTGNNTYEAISFVIPTERDIQLHTWAMRISGSIAVSLITQDAKTLFHTTAGQSGAAHTIHLEAGQYRVMLHFSIVMGAGGVVGVSYRSYYTAHMPILPDTDIDSLQGMLFSAPTMLLSKCILESAGCGRIRIWRFSSRAPVAWVSRFFRLQTGVKWIFRKHGL